jgi:hypothetical protein
MMPQADEFEEREKKQVIRGPHGSLWRGHERNDVGLCDPGIFSNQAVVYYNTGSIKSRTVSLKRV